jgi:hypothetical protein
LPFLGSIKIAGCHKNIICSTRKSETLKNQFFSSEIELKNFFLIVKHAEFFDASNGVFGLIRLVASPSKTTKNQGEVFGPRNRIFLS